MNFEHWRHSARAWVFHFLGKNDLAFDEYAIAFRHQPDAKVARNLGFIAVQRGRPADGAQWFSEAVRLDGTRAETWFNLGFAREQNGQRREAIEAFREAVRLAPSLDRAWYGMGIAHAALGEHGDAATALEMAAKLQPMNGEAWYQLGMAHHHAHAPERVVEVIEKLKSFEPKRANQLIRDAGRSDLHHLHTDLPF